MEVALLYFYKKDFSPEGIGELEMLVEMLNVFLFHLRQEDVSEVDTGELAQHITRMSLMSD